MINVANITPEIAQELSLQYLYDQWRLAEIRHRTWWSFHIKYPEDSVIARRMINYQQLLQIIYNELLRRTDHLNIEFILQLINTGCGFTIKIQGYE